MTAPKQPELSPWLRGKELSRGFSQQWPTQPLDFRTLAEVAFGVPSVVHVLPTGGVFDVMVEEFSHQGSTVQTVHEVAPWGAAIALPGGMARVSARPQVPQSSVVCIAAPGRTSVTVTAPATIAAGAVVLQPPRFATLLRVAVNGAGCSYNVGFGFGPPLPVGTYQFPPAVYTFAAPAGESIAYAWELTR